MTTVRACDRCGCFGPVKSSFSDTLDLCGGCADDFTRWWALGKEVTRPLGTPGHHRPRGWAYRVASDLVFRLGYASPQDFAERAGCTRKQAYDALTTLKRSGLLTGGWQAKKGLRFYLPDVFAGAAE